MTPATAVALGKKIEKGNQCINYIESLSRNAIKSNEGLLMKLLEENKDTEYGKKYGFAQIKNVQEYMQKVPLTTYEDYEEYIERITDGEKNVLSVRDIVHFAESSGSSGSPKKVPMCQEALDMFIDYTLNLCFASMDKYLGEDWVKSRGLSLAGIKLKTVGEGFSYGAVSGKIRQRYRDVEHYVYTSPLVATYPEGDIDTRYLHLRFALMEEDLSFITCAFLNSAVDIMKYFENNWEVIAKDIELGTIDENISIPHKIKEEILKTIKPMEKRGRFIKTQCELGFKDILTKVWPNFKFVYGIGGGGFAVYEQKMRYYMGNAKLHQSIYSASEGIFATNLKPESDNMVMILDSAFYEFIHVKDPTAKAITLEQVTVGQDYELVLTNLSGFYRYKIKDIVRVTGFYGTCPIIKFLYRKNQMISLAGEKTNDYAMHDAMLAFTKKVDFDLVEYSLYADYNHSPARYIVFIEGENFKKKYSLKEYGHFLEEELFKTNPSYKDKVERKLIASLKIELLREGAYSVYRQLMCVKGVAENQLKPVRLIDNQFRKNFFFSMVKHP